MDLLYGLTVRTYCTDLLYGLTVQTFCVYCLYVAMYPVLLPASFLLILVCSNALYCLFSHQGSDGILPLTMHAACWSKVPSR